MGIPYRFDPMGTLGSELPYVQPIMTGYNTWSNAPSFGLSIAANSEFLSGYAWKAMDGDPRTKWQTNTGSGKRLTLTLANEITLHGLNVACKYNGRLTRFAVSADGVVLIDESDIADFNTPKYFAVEPTLCRKIVIEIATPYVSGSFGGIHTLELDATYKP